MLVAFGIYARLVQLTNKLVREVNEGRPEMDLRWYRWNKAWRPHRLLYPASTVRRSIVVCFLLCWLLMCGGLACVGLAQVHR
jgi:hypothetical protein